MCELHCILDDLAKRRSQAAGMIRREADDFTSSTYFLRSGAAAAATRARGSIRVSAAKAGRPML